MHTMITAHSGCEGRPDNSLEYVQYALHCGADALEVDVHPKDDGFYISHDPSGHTLAKGPTVAMGMLSNHADLLHSYCDEEGCICMEYILNLAWTEDAPS